MIKQAFKRLIPSSLWKLVRERKIVATHAKVANICSQLVESYCKNSNAVNAVHARVQFPENTKLIWQYWAQGYGNVPEIVHECLNSVDKYCQSYTIVRLDDSNIDEYIDLPEYVKEKRTQYGYAHFSDLLRVVLLNTYGGVWMDATILLTAPLPEKYFETSFFAFQRDPREPNKEYWENTYAYYFSWANGFRVNMLNSFMASKPGTELIAALCNCILEWWRQNDSMPDYFFFQILFDVLVTGIYKDENCKIESDFQSIICSSL